MKFFFVCSNFLSSYNKNDVTPKISILIAFNSAFTVYLLSLKYFISKWLPNQLIKKN